MYNRVKDISQWYEVLYKLWFFIEILFNNEIVSYRQILEFFFQIHDPSTENRQGNDTGASYRSAIYYVSDEQRAEAVRTIADVDACGLWPGKVVTEVEPVSDFWEAEVEHQDYLETRPNGYTCHFVRPDWKLPSVSWDFVKNSDHPDMTTAPSKNWF